MASTEEGEDPPTLPAMMIGKHEVGGEEPPAIHIDLTVDSDTIMDTSQQSTKSSSDRKLRQVLQKKQLDVLLQTYSSFLEENEGGLSLKGTFETNTDIINNNTSTSCDFYSITRKNSIEGNLNPIARVAQMVHVTSAQQRASANKRNTELRERMRTSKSLLQDDDDCSGLGEHSRQQQDTNSDTNSDEAVAASKKQRTSKELKGANKETEQAGLGEGRKNKKKTIGINTNSTKKKKRMDFAARMRKANEAIKGFATRATQRQVEIAADFHVVTKELRHHLKNGANVMFEELADHFDGIVGDLFVGENDQRDDEGDDQRQTQRQIFNIQSGDRQGCGPILIDSDFQPRTHEETIEIMAKQVTDLLEPVVVLGEDFNCSNGGTKTQIELVPSCTSY